MTDPDANHFIVTLKDVYQEMRTADRDTSTALLSLKESVDHFGGQMTVLSEQMETARKERGDHEQRIRSLERWRYAFPISALTALGSLALAVAAFLHR